MRIKNKALLVERAEWHAEQDHITQGTYGRGDVNGHTVFQGCVIGCIATPHVGLADHLREHLLDDRYAGMVVDGHQLYYLDLTSGEMTAAIAEEFGIDEDLLRIAEDLFESLDTHGAAINFIPAFARAVPEGADIGWQEANALWAEVKDIDDAQERADEFLTKLAGLA